MSVRVVLNPRLIINEMQGYNPAPGALDGAIRHRWPGLLYHVENTDGFGLRGGGRYPTTAHKLGLVPDCKFLIARQGRSSLRAFLHQLFIGTKVDKGFPSGLGYARSAGSRGCHSGWSAFRR